MVKIGDDYYTFIVDCADPKACTVLLRGASKQLLNEVGAGGMFGRGGEEWSERRESGKNVEKGRSREDRGGSNPRKRCGAAGQDVRAKKL